MGPSRLDGVDFVFWECIIGVEDLEEELLPHYLCTIIYTIEFMTSKRVDLHFSLLVRAICRNRAIETMCLTTYSNRFIITS
jgi:hypothetical protein